MGRTLSNVCEAVCRALATLVVSLHSHVYVTWYVSPTGITYVAVAGKSIPVQYVLSGKSVGGRMWNSAQVTAFVVYPPGIPVNGGISVSAEVTLTP